MNPQIFSLLLLQTVFAFLVQATLYITSPLPSTMCTGGKPCTVEWFDDGVSPLLADIGACHVALYNGEEKLIQQINPVDVSAQHGLQFTPDPKAGPDSSTYYINFTSVNPVDGATYHEYSTFFTINSMQGSFSSPVPSDSSAISVPSTLTASHSSSSISTITVGATSSSSSASSASATPSPSSSSHLSSSSPSSLSRLPPSSESAASIPSSSSSTTASSTPSSSSSTISSSSSSSSASTSSGFVTSFTGAVTTLVLPAPSALGTTASTTTAPSAPTSSSASTTDINQTSSAFRPAAGAIVPLFLSSLVTLAFRLLL